MDAHDPLAAEALVIAPRASSDGIRELTSASPHNPEFRQMRASGKLLMCLEVEDRTQGGWHSCTTNLVRAGENVETITMPRELLAGRVRRHGGPRFRTGLIVR